MNKQQSLTFQMELLWWVITAIILFAVLFPILNKVEDYPFLIPNILFIIIFVTLTRYIFLLKHTFLAYRQTLKIILFFLCIPLIWYIVSQLENIQGYIDQEGINGLVKNLPYEEHWQFANYIKTEMYFFGAASLVVTVLFPLRLLQSVWRNKNRGTV